MAKRTPIQRSQSKWLKSRHEFNVNEWLRPSVIITVFHDLVRMKAPHKISGTAEHRWHRAFVCAGLAHIGGRTPLESSRDLAWTLKRVARSRADWGHLPPHWATHWLRMMQDGVAYYRREPRHWHKKRRLIPLGADWFWFLLCADGQSHWTHEEFFAGGMNTRLIVEKVPIVSTYPPRNRNRSSGSPRADVKLFDLL